MQIAPLFALLCSQAVLSQFITEMPAPMDTALVAERQIVLGCLPKQHIAFNPSIVQYHDQILMIFRRDYKPGNIALETQLAVVPLDANFRPTQAYQLLDTRLSPGRLHQNNVCF